MMALANGSVVGWIDREMVEAKQKKLATLINEVDFHLKYSHFNGNMLCC